MAVRLTEDQVRRLRLRGQGITPPLPGAAAGEAARRVCGLQAQDMFAATLGVRVRSRGATLAGVEKARFEERGVVWTWAMRGTLHLLAAEDLDWLLPLVGPVLVAAGRRRRLQLGLDEETYGRGLHAVRRHLASHGPATREELSPLMSAAGVPAGYPAERHLLYRATIEGLLCMGPNRGSKATFALIADWLGRPLAPVTQEEALARLAARYLAAYGPAAPADLAAWSGLPVAVVRAAWEAAGGLAEVTVGGRPAWLPRERLAELEEPPPDPPDVRLLPAFETYLLGYRDRSLVIDPAATGRVFIGGMIRPVLLVDGRVAGIWKPNRKGRRVDISVEPFGGLPPGAEAGIAAETADIHRFLGEPAGV